MFLKRWYICQSPHPGGKRVPEEGTKERETHFTIIVLRQPWVEQLDSVIRITRLSDKDVLAHYLMNPFSECWCNMNF